MDFACISFNAKPLYKTSFLIASLFSKKLFHPLWGFFILLFTLRRTVRLPSKEVLSACIFLARRTVHSLFVIFLFQSSLRLSFLADSQHIPIAHRITLNHLCL